MQLKKNPKADLTKNSSLYFAIGLAAVLFISWQAIEWKTYDKSGYGYEALNVEDEDDEEVPITEQLKTPPPPPPPPPPAPEVIEIVEDEEEVEETVIESTETDQEEIVEIDDIEVEDDFEDDDKDSKLFNSLYENDVDFMFHEKSEKKAKPGKGSNETIPLSKEKKFQKLKTGLQLLKQ